MYQEYIITATEVKSIVPELNNDVSDILINNAIKMVENTVLIDSCGQEWADELITQKSGGTYTTANKYVIDNYIKNMLAYSVWQYLVITLSYQMNSAGLRIKNSDHSVAGESKDIAFYRDFTQNFIDRTRSLMKRYIDLHKSDYPLFFNNIYNDKPHTYNFRIGKI